MSVLKTKFINLTISLVSIGSINVAADSTVSEQVYVNLDCDSSQKCDLERFFVKTISKNEDNVGQTFMSAGFTTTSNKALKKYAIVQFHQGCIYKKNTNGESEFFHRTYMGLEGVPFVHVDMSVDSAEDADPIYQSSYRGGQDDGFGYIFPRKEFYFTHPPIFDGSSSQQSSYMNNLDNPKVRSLYVSDIPTFADLNKNEIASLNFVTCIYKTEDVPHFLENPNRENMGEAIKCFDWNHNWKISTTNTLQRTTEIDSTCLEGEE